MSTLRHILLTAALALALPLGPAWSVPALADTPPAQAAAPAAAGRPEPVLPFGENWYTTALLPGQHYALQPGISLWAGYRFVSLEGAARAAEYDLLRPSVIGGLGLHYYPLPFMFDADFGYNSARDHDADVRISYADVMKLDYRSTELFHNMDHYLPVPTGTDFDPGRKYGVAVNDNALSLTLKSPGRPYHVYVDLREFRKDGTVQQRVLLLEAHSRDIGWVTRELTAGINGSIPGVLELDYHHTIKSFDNEGTRAAGPYPDTIFTGNTILHDQIPDIVSNYDTFSAHTDQGRAITAAGTFTFGDKKNRTSGAKAEFLREYGDVAYRPWDNLVFAVKYGHQRLDVSAPGQITDFAFNGGAPPAPPSDVFVITDIRPSVSTKRDKAAATVTYYPWQSLMLTAKYELDSVERSNTDVWNDDVAAESLNFLKARSTTHSGTVTASYTPMRHTKLRAGFTYARNDDPSYITDYENSYKGYVWGSWVPTPGLTVTAQYKLLRGNNPVINNGQSPTAIDRLNRHAARDNGGAGVTWLAARGLVLGAHYDYLRWRVTQNIMYTASGQGDTIFVNMNTPYEDTSHTYTVFARYCFGFPLSLQADFSQCWSRGNYSLDSLLFSIPPGSSASTDALASLADQSVRDIRLTVKADYEIAKGFGLGLAYGLSQYKDLKAAPTAESRNGIAHFYSVLLTKRFM